MDNSFI